MSIELAPKFVVAKPHPAGGWFGCRRESRWLLLREVGRLTVEVEHPNWRVRFHFHPGSRI
jgi:hypothetical protein